jgi:serine/threonine-protein kinase
VNGEVLAGRYRLLGLLGRGGVGEVWRAEDLQLGRPVAIKLLRRLEGDALSSLERFRREARATAQLSHPNVVATYDVGTTDDRAYLVMELVRGGDLAQLLRSHGLPPAEEVADLAIQAARGLDAAHAAGIVHRDVKPANLLLSSDGMLKITDFGIARMAGTDQTGGLTGPVLLGTAAYLAPEQVRGEPATPASDRYALGCVLYELLAGRPPFTGETHEVLDGHVHQEPVPVLEYRPDTGAGLSDLVMLLLAKDPAARPATAAEAETCLGATAVVEPPPTEVITLPQTAPDDEFEPRGSGVSPNVRRGAMVGVVAAAALAVALGVAKLASDDATPLAEARPPSVQPTATTKAPKPTPTPTVHKTTPTPKPTPTATPNSQAAKLRALADLLRKEDAHGRAARMLRAAARDLDQAAAAVAKGDDGEAARQMRDAYRRLGEAQREGQWRPSPQVLQAFRQLGPLPGQNGDGQHND